MYVSNRLRFKKSNDLSINSENVSFEQYLLKLIMYGLLLEPFTDPLTQT